MALADDKAVRGLNKRHAGKDKPTNVLSYPSGERAFLGDIVLARQIVWREARAQKKSPADHVTHLVVHGTLHLLGHDHETGDADAEDHVVTQSNMSFSTADLTVKVGDTVSFSNRDSMAHNVYSLSDAKTFDLGSSAPNTSKKVTLDQPGVVDVECALHPSMRMKIKVTQ